MIIGRNENMLLAQAFIEIDDAVSALTDRCVVFRAHRTDTPGGLNIPEGAIIYNTENVPQQVPDPRERWAGHEIWDIGKANAARYGAVHVPVGWHPTMERFKRAEHLDIDIVFTGSINERRQNILLAMQDRGLHVCHVPYRAFGAERDALIARAKLALNMQYYPDGMYPQLRVAHLVANKVPVLSERAEEGWNFVPECTYEELVDRAVELVRMGRRDGEYRAQVAYDAFRSNPMRLPR
jgi:hypothetical protein